MTDRADRIAEPTYTLGATGIVHGRKPVDVLFCDADGTLREGPPGADGRPGFINGPADVNIMPDAAARIAEHRENGGRVVIVSNQGGVGAGIVEHVDVASAFGETLHQLRAAAGEHYTDDPMVDVVVWCTHDPGLPPEKAAAANRPARPPDRCWCRKPMPGLLYEAIHLLRDRHPDEHYPLDRMLMVGNADEDRGAAHAAGVDFLDAHAWRNGLPGHIERARR